MAKIFSIHSFRGGTGKSNIVANLAGIYALQGNRVGVIDTDIQSPGIHILFGLEGEEIKNSLNDYLWHDLEIEKAALNITANVGSEIEGEIFLIPASIKPGEITRVLREGYNARKLTQGLSDLVEKLNLDILLIDTHPGLNEETLLSIVISDALLVVMRPDKQDYEGTGITITVAKELKVPNLMIAVNKAPLIYDPEAIRIKVEQTYGCEVATVIPHSDELMNLASEGVFSLLYPDDPITEHFYQIANKLMA